MTKDKLYRLMDVLDEIKQVDEILSVHVKDQKNTSSLMVNQYKAKKEKLLAYLINEINSSPEHRSYRLKLIGQVMDQFYSTPKVSHTITMKGDSELSQLEEAILAS